MPSRGHRSRPLSYAKIEASAWSVRRQILPDLAPTDAVPGVALFESLDEITLDPGRGEAEVPMNYEVGKLPGNFEGWTKYDPERNEIVVVLDEATYIGLEAGKPRPLFALAHEIGHAALHFNELVRLARASHEDNLALSRATDHEVFRDTEFHANTFAAAFLMPVIGLQELEKGAPFFSSYVIRDTFHVSYSAADIRLEVYEKRKEDLLRAVRR